ncbi:hypothetical protein CRE_13492 [Caenorhabditis remanei]|uniref:Uncharacterized protein n=1 Tax=Caenorhabditis remanei TaxID=31234 RepID=E3MRA4_CAERE|nr:hypothetical protein CRE_13492 [Caenorhabditis remanei]
MKILLVLILLTFLATCSVTPTSNSVGTDLQSSHVKRLFRKNRRIRVSREKYPSTHAPGDFRPFTGSRTTLKNWIV